MSKVYEYEIEMEQLYSDNSWQDFQEMIEATSHEDMDNMTPDEAKKFVEMMYE